MYITRHLEDTVKRLGKMFGAVLVTGPRQVGKTTMLKTVANGIPYLTLGDPILMQMALEEAGSFLRAFPRRSSSMTSSMRRTSFPTSK